ncbi:hypothetical protein K501DRAFT_311668 [Backusella circina FSU 941]|nr:hypothetical protein K501DRAFT_311668 [Backusella circina FSU 941]
MTRLYSLASLVPDSYGIETTAKITELLVSLETKDELKPITIYEYIIADDTGCIILNTQQQLEVDQVYTLKDGYTKLIEDNLRLYSNTLLPCPEYKMDSIDLHNNRSFISFHYKL